MRSHGRFVAVGLAVLFAYSGSASAYVGPFGTFQCGDFSAPKPDERPPQPGERLGEYVLADRVPSYPPLSEWVPPQMEIPPGYTFDARPDFNPDERELFWRQCRPRWPMPADDRPPKPGECLGDYALGELPSGPASVAKRTATGTPRSALTRVTHWFESAVPVALPPPPLPVAPPPRPSKGSGQTWLPFAGPDELRIAFEGSGGTFEEPVTALDAAQWLNLRQGRTHRFRLTGLVPHEPDRALVATITVAPATLSTIPHLHRAAVVLRFRPEEAAQATERPVVKVMYLPALAEPPTGQIANAKEVVSTDLAPGTDPVAEAKSRGVIVAVIRLSAVETAPRPRER